MTTMVADTRDTCEDPGKLNKIERRIFDKIIRFRELENLTPLS